MKAVRYHSYGESEVLTYEEAERPTPGPGQVAIRVAGSAFNPVDAAIRAGYLREVFPLEFPHIPDFDVAGVITDLGEGVEGRRVGEEVVAFLPMNTPGAAAEYALVPAEALAAAPRTVELADAAALPSAVLTAWQSLFELGGVGVGSRVLINGAGGAVGGYAVQLAKQAGAVVTATGSARSAERLRGYGADRVVDHAATPLPEAVADERFDLVLNLVVTSPEETARLVDLAADGGAFVSTTTPGPEDAGRGVRTVRVFARSDAAQLSDLVARIDAGELRLGVVERRPLADLRTVHDEAAAGRLSGKIVLIP
jgi:NADPH:quinone reductase-like Zn-dependent oxidoreductase